MAYVERPGFHRHKCKFCGFVWEHHDINDARHGDGGAHECPSCHRCNWSLGIYVGAERPRAENGVTPAAEGPNITSPLQRPDVDEYADPADINRGPGRGQTVIHPDQAHTFGD